MLKTYRIIPFTFILFLFGFTLITVSPVFAQGQWDPSMGMCHNSRPCMKSNMCGKQCAANVRESKGWVNPKISELEAGLTRLQVAITKLQEQPKNSMQQGAPTAPSGGEVAELKAMIFELAECHDTVLWSPHHGVYHDISGRQGNCLSWVKP